VISTVLVEHPWLSPLALAMLVVLGPPVGWWLATRPRLAWTLATASLLPVAFLTVVPTGRRTIGGCDVAWMLPTPARVELAANEVLFVAPVLLVAVALGRPLLAVFLGSGLSVVIEVFQLLVSGLGRSCSTNDWLCNTIGALIGATLAWASLLLAQRRSDRMTLSLQEGSRWT
jgi:hypothetical protein